MAKYIVETNGKRYRIRLGSTNQFVSNKNNVVRLYRTLFFAQRKADQMNGYEKPVWVKVNKGG